MPRLLAKVLICNPYNYVEFYGDSSILKQVYKPTYTIGDY